MANPVACDSQDQALAVVLVGNLDNGQQQAFCGPCFSRFALLTAVTTLPKAEIEEQLRQVPSPDGQPEGEQRPGAEVRPRRKPRARKATTNGEGG